VKKRNLPPVTSADAQVGWATILGLVDPGTPEWGRVRAEQVNILRSFAMVRLAFSIMAGCVVVATVGSTSSPWLLMGWFAAVMIVSGVLAWPHLRNQTGPRISATVGDLHRETLSLALAGVAWTALPIALGISGQDGQLLTVWTVATALMGPIRLECRLLH
jgi:hypothetical protein